MTGGRYSQDVSINLAIARFQVMYSGYTHGNTSGSFQFGILVFILYSASLARGYSWTTKYSSAVVQYYRSTVV